MPSKRHTQSQMHPEKNQQVCTHACSHTGMEAQTNTQMPQPACHLSADRRNTPATSSQSAFHHSVTTCQLQSPSLRHSALIFTNCAAAWDTTQPCQKYDTGRITLLHLLAYTHTHVHTLSHTCTCVCIHANFTQCMKTARNYPHKSIKSVSQSSICWSHVHTSTHVRPHKLKQIICFVFVFGP